jgi:hypothetical protein
MEFYAFDLRDVRLISGPILLAQTFDPQHRLELDPGRLFHNFLPTRAC